MRKNKGSARHSHATTSADKQIKGERELCRDATDRQVKLTQCYVNAEGTCGDGRHCGSPKTITNTNI